MSISIGAGALQLRSRDRDGPSHRRRWLSVCLDDFEVAVEVGVVGFGVVHAIVDAAAFLAEFGGVGDEEGGGEHVLAFPADGGIEDLVHDVAVPELDDFLGLGEGSGLAGDADVAPHEGAEGVADVGGVEAAAVGVRNLVFDEGVLDGGDIGSGAGGDGAAGEAAEDEAFEE